MSPAAICGIDVFQETISEKCLVLRKIRKEERLYNGAIKKI